MPLVSDVVWDPLSNPPFRGCHLPFYTARGIDPFAPHLEEIPPKVTAENARVRHREREREQDLCK